MYDEMLMSFAKEELPPSLSEAPRVIRQLGLDTEPLKYYPQSTLNVGEWRDHEVAIARETALRQFGIHLTEDFRRNARVIGLIAPSGFGKSTIVKALKWLQERLGREFFVIPRLKTTRGRREEDRDVADVEYEYISNEQASAIFLDHFNSRGWDDGSTNLIFALRFYRSWYILTKDELQRVVKTGLPILMPSHIDMVVPLEMIFPTRVHKRLLLSEWAISNMVSPRSDLMLDDYIWRLHHQTGKLREIIHVDILGKNHSYLTDSLRYLRNFDDPDLRFAQAVQAAIELIRLSCAAQGLPCQGANEAKLLRQADSLTQLYWDTMGNQSQRRQRFLREMARGPRVRDPHLDPIRWTDELMPTENSHPDDLASGYAHVSPAATMY